MILAAAEVREAEHEARRQRLGLAHLLQGDEGKVTSPGPRTFEMEGAVYYSKSWRAP
jgi:hypothetical protein